MYCRLVSRKSIEIAGTEPVELGLELELELESMIVLLSDVELI